LAFFFFGKDLILIINLFDIGPEDTKNINDSIITTITYGSCLSRHSRLATTAGAPEPPPTAEQGAKIIEKPYGRKIRAIGRITVTSPN